MNNFVFSVTFLIYLPKYVAKIQKERVLISRAQWGRALLRPLSLSGSLIDKDFITIDTLAGKGCQRTVCHQIDITTK